MGKNIYEQYWNREELDRQQKSKNYKWTKIAFYTSWGAAVFCGIGCMKALLFREDLLLIRLATFILLVTSIIKSKPALEEMKEADGDELQ